MAALKWGDLVSKILKPNAPLSSGEVAALLVKLSAEDVTECIAEQCALGRDVVALVRAVFSGLRDDEDGAEVRLLVLKKLLEFLASSSLWTEQQLSDCVSLLITEIAKLPTQDDTRLYELTVELVNLWHGKSAVVWGACRCFDVLPHLCKRLAAVELRDAAGAGAAPCSGPELCEQLLNSIINLPKWPREPLYKMLEALRDVPLAPLTLRHLCNRIGDLFADIPLTDMPVLVESFVKYSTRGFRVNILQRIIRAFDSLNQRSLDAAASVSSSSSSSSSQMVGVAPPPLSREQFEMEATALLFIETQFTQDQELGREFLDDLKKTSLLTPFTIALVLCLARIQRFKEQSFDLLRNVIVASCKHAQHRKQSPWLAAVAPRCTAAHLATTLRQTIVFMAEGAWPIQESMVELGFLLGDCVAPKQVAEIGETILVALFELQASARSAILDSIVTRIDAHSKSAAFYAGMLEKAIHVAPEHAASSITPKIRELFYYLSMLEPKIARILLRAVSSLIRSSTQLFDHVVLVLRKAMFSRESSARLIAVEGFLELLACLHTSEPHPSDPNRSIAQVQYEILGTSRERERERESERPPTPVVSLCSHLSTQASCDAASLNNTRFATSSTRAYPRSSNPHRQPAHKSSSCYTPNSSVTVVKGSRRRSPIASSAPRKQTVQVKLASSSRSISSSRASINALRARATRPGTRGRRMLGSRGTCKPSRSSSSRPTSSTTSSTSRRTLPPRLSMANTTSSTARCCTARAKP